MQSMKNILATLIFILPQWTPVFAQQAPLKLSPQIVTDLALSKADQKLVIELKRRQGDIYLPRARAPYRWGTSLESNYSETQAENISGLSNDEEHTFYSKWAFGRLFTTGTKARVTYEQTNVDRELSTFGSSVGQPEQVVYNVFSFEVEQDLWQNTFGVIDRLNLEIAKTQTTESKWDELEALEDHVLEILNIFWSTYVAHETLQEAIASRERYQQLLKVVQRKSRLGSTQPGELARTRAEVSQQDESVKQNTTQFLLLLDQLKTALNIEHPGDIVDFQIDTIVPELPAFGEVELDELRAIKKNQLSLQRAEADQEIKESEGDPVVKLIAKVQSTGLERDSSSATSELTSFAKPTYFAGLNIKFYIGNETSDAELSLAKVNKRLANLRLSMAKKMLKDQLANAERSVKSNRLVLQSRVEQVKERETAFEQIRRAFRQGRVNITELIMAANLLTAARTAKIQATGDYHLSIDQLAALKDELIK